MFDMREFSIVMRLPFSDPSMVQNRRTQFEALNRLIGGKEHQSTIVRVRLAERLAELVSSDDTSIEVLTNVKRLFIVLVCALVLFPTSHHTLLMSLHWYIDNLEGISELNWAPLSIGSFVRK